MSPHLHSTVADRYTLTSELRVQPGFSAWLATDSTLGRDCQLFMVSDPALTARANAITSSLALSSNPYFTPVRQLLRDGDASLIITDLDEGVSVHELLEHGRKFGPEGMRAIMCELCDAADSLLEVSLNHQGICAGTVRLVPDGVKLADAPVSCVIRPWAVDGEQSLHDEQLAIKQIAGVLFAMITGKDFMPGVNDTLPDAFHADGVPSEYATICSRALEVPAVAGKKPVPLLTLREMRVLLGDPIAWDQLPSGELPAIDGQGAPSIGQVALVPTMESEERKAKEAEEIREEEAARKAKEAERKAKDASWDAGQLLFAGGKAVEDVKPSAEDTNILAPLAPLDDAPAPAEPEEPAYVNTLNSRKTMMMDVSQIRQTVAHDNAADEQEPAPADGGAAAAVGDAQDDEMTRPMAKAPALPDRPADEPAPADGVIADERELAEAADNSLAVIVAETEAVEAAKAAKKAQAEAIAETEAPALPPRPESKPAGDADSAPAAAQPVAAASTKPMAVAATQSGGVAARDASAPVSASVAAQPASASASAQAVAAAAAQPASEQGVPASTAPQSASNPAMPVPPVPSRPQPAATAVPANHLGEAMPPVIAPATKPVAPLIDEDEDATTLPPSFAPTFLPQRGVDPDAMLADHSDDGSDGEDQPVRSRKSKIIGAIIGVLIFLALVGGGVALIITMMNSHSGTPDQGNDQSGWPGINENEVPFPGKNGSTTGAASGSAMETLAAAPDVVPPSGELVIVPGTDGW